ncbi:histidine--tRNA ligase, putative [Plasmodium vinckei brucechwatti]|uniref:histidine--tRNA ligase n=1 Tax=Plasmodium vinckei brucechwatti TaxID=119398 RepID=A0A6V7SLQ6_PLAVN|nr:histidine--tRNA ligase, putative [Plasmodium vinckei brucechwatti]
MRYLPPSNLSVYIISKRNKDIYFFSTFLRNNNNNIVNKMSINVYKNKVFNTKDVVEVSVNNRVLKLEPSSFKDCFYKLNDNRKSIEDLEKIYHTYSISEKWEVENEKIMDSEKERKNGISNNVNHLEYDIVELKCLYFFFLINILRFKNTLDLNLIRNVCNSINSMQVSNTSSKIYYLKNNNSLYSEILKNFLIENIQKSGKSEYNINDFNTFVNKNIERTSLMFLNFYRITSSCKYLTCCLCNILELFNINTDVLFKNSFNNNINNSNIQSINNLISKIKWMSHDSKIDKDKEISKNFGPNLLLFLYTQSKLGDDGEYFLNTINHNFKNFIEKSNYDSVEDMNSISSYVNLLCKNFNHNFKEHIKNVISIISKILPLYAEKISNFILTNECIDNEHESLKGPPFSGITFASNIDVNNSKNFLTELYETEYLKSIENHIANIDGLTELEALKKLYIIFNDLLILLTDICINMNIMYDIKSYNKALSQVLKNKKVSSCVYNIGAGCLEFKNFLYSIVSETYDTSEIKKDSKLLGDKLFFMLRKNFAAYKYNKEISEILMQKNINFNLKVPKGAKDFTGEDMQLRNIFFDFIKNKFLIHGGVEIDTPVFELKETLIDKYGEDSKLIFDLKDQGGESLSLRYDLTVPLYRFFNTNNLNALKRFHIGKVYRRDEPSMSKGRFREFYQCDFDIVGKYDTLKADFHILHIFWDILTNLKNVIGNFICKINHRKILEFMLLSSNIHKDKVKTVSSSIDKLDKITFQQFRDELLNEKGISVDSVDKIETYISKTLSLSPFLVIEFLRNDLNESSFDENYKKDINDVINHLEQIFELLKHFNMLNQFSFDLSLARGLDYYTGIIFEFVLLSDTSVGSIGAGGRYDYLIRNKRKEYIPSVGASIGIERIITIAEEVVRKKMAQLLCSENTTGGDNASSNANDKSKLNLKDNAVEVLICNTNKNAFKQTIELCKKLWEENIATEFVYFNDQRLQKQFSYALEKQIPLVIIIGDEIERGVIKLRELTLDKSKSVGDKEIKLSECVQEVKNYFNCNLAWKQNIMNILFGSTK